MEINGLSFLLFLASLKKSHSHTQSMLRIDFFCTTPKIAQKSYALYSQIYLKTHKKD